MVSNIVHQSICPSLTFLKIGISVTSDIFACSKKLNSLATNGFSVVFVF